MEFKLANYGKGKSKLLLRLSMFFKGVTGLLAVSTYIMANPTLAIVIVVIGAVATELVEFIKEEQKEDATPDSTKHD